MKILIDLTSLADNFSGMERYAASISKNLVNNSNHVFVLIFKNEIHDQFAFCEKNPNVSYVVLKGKNKLIFNQTILPMQLYRIKADIYLFLAFPAPLIFRKKNIISTIHDMVCWDCPKTMKITSKYYFRCSIKHAVRCSNKLLTVSEFSKACIIKRFPEIREKIHIVYDGVDDQFHIHAKVKNNINLCQKYHIPANYILCLSTVEPRKNISLLLKAFEAVKSRGDFPYELVIAGRKGWKVETLLNNISDECKKHIFFTGFIEDADLPILYANAQCFIFPPIYEGFGIPPIEALASGTKVIASDIPVLKEILGNNVVYFKSNNQKSLEEKLQNIIVDKDLWDENRVEEISKEMKSKFSWSKEAEKLNQILEKVEIYHERKE